jgi:hypothetical protein
MAFPLKRILFFLFAVSVLRASPALSVPLATGNDYSVAGGEATSQDGQFGPFEQVNGNAEGTEARARIVDNDQLAYGPTSEKSEVAAAHPAFGMSGQASMSAGGGSHTPGWLLPAAAVGAGGGALFALTSHGKHGNGNDGSGVGMSSSGGSGGEVALGGGNGHTPGDETPSTVPEPGTMTLMGLGIASILGRKKLVRR